MRVLFDTAAFIWAVGATGLLSSTAKRLLADETVIVEISVLSLSEIAIKSSRERLDFSKEDVTVGLSSLRASVLPFTEDHAVGMFGLLPHHRDPFDRQITAQALTEKIPVVTPDKIFKLYAGLQTIW